MELFIGQPRFLGTHCAYFSPAARQGLSQKDSVTVVQGPSCLFLFFLDESKLAENAHLSTKAIL